MRERVILHCDLNGFFAGVECLLNPALNAGPMAVCGDPARRHGIILAKNEEAKKYGIITAETVWQAKRKCPTLTLVQPHHEAYAEYSKLCNEIYYSYTDLVEPFGIDESWLDVTGSQHLFGSGVQIADSIRQTVREQTGLSVSVGVSYNKIFAKLGSDYKKPDATTVISRENFRAVVHPLPVEALLFVGRRAKKALADMGINTIGALASYDRSILSHKMGSAGALIHDYANGLDVAPVLPFHEQPEIKSVGNGTTFAQDLCGLAQLEPAVFMLCDEVTSRMRRRNLRAATLQVSIKDANFTSIQRQKPFDKPSCSAREFCALAMAIIKETPYASRAVRALRVTASNLVDKDAVFTQTSLFAAPIDTDKQDKIDSTVDKIRDRYGTQTIQYGTGFQKKENGGDSEDNDLYRTIDN